jgi:hypothetical protein
MNGHRKHDNLIVSLSVSVPDSMSEEDVSRIVEETVKSGFDALFAYLQMTGEGDVILEETAVLPVAELDEELALMIFAAEHDIEREAFERQYNEGYPSALALEGEEYLYSDSGPLGHVNSYR